MDRGSSYWEQPAKNNRVAKNKQIGDHMLGRLDISCCSASYLIRWLINPIFTKHWQTSWFSEFRLLAKCDRFVLFTQNTRKHQTKQSEVISVCVDGTGGVCESFILVELWHVTWGPSPTNMNPTSDVQFLSISETHRPDRRIGMGSPVWILLADLLVTVMEKGILYCHLRACVVCRPYLYDIITNAKWLQQTARLKHSPQWASHQHPDLNRSGIHKRATIRGYAPISPFRSATSL